MEKIKSEKSTVPVLPIVLRYHEVALKGDNRRWFEDRLAMNAKRLVQRALGPSLQNVVVKHLHGRLLMNAPWNETSRDALARVFGISSFSPVHKVKTDVESIRVCAVEETKNYIHQYGMPKTFRVATRRSDKALPQNSNELSRIVGSAIHDKYPNLTVDLENPEFTVGLELRFDESFIWTEKFSGQGGLPVGTNAPVLSLISGGLDSPIAAIQAIRRGSPCSFIHFYGTPFVGEDVLRKIEDLVRLVNRFQPEQKPLYIVPFGKIQEKIALVTNPKMRTILYRRMMVRIANRLAIQIGAKALITGESVGQVASQTVENIATVDAATTLPILRPLITCDKDEIIEKAKRWGTFETSIRPGIDCCTLFADRHPTLKTTCSLIEEQELKFSVDDLTQEALDSIYTNF